MSQIPPMKLNWATKNRRKEREANLKMLNDLERSNGDTRRINELKKSLITPSAVQVDEVRQLVTAFGLPHVNAPYEAEAQCAELVLQNIAHAVVTEDSDVLPLGVSLIRKLNTTEQFDLKAALSKMEINQREFIDFCLLSGTDYLPTLKNMGPVRALRAIKDHKTIEKILSVKDASVVPSPFEEARKMFTEPMVTPANEISIQWAKMDIEKVIEFLCRGQRTFDEPGFRQKLTGLQSDIDKRTKSSAKRASDSHEDASESKKKVKCSPDEIPVPYITPDWKTGEGVPYSAVVKFLEASKIQNDTVQKLKILWEFLRAVVNKSPACLGSVLMLVTAGQFGINQETYALCILLRRFTI